MQRMLTSRIYRQDYTKHIIPFVAGAKRVSQVLEVDREQWTRQLLLAAHG